jgi:hypothetical protein
VFATLREIGEAGAQDNMFCSPRFYCKPISKAEMIVARISMGISPPPYFLSPKIYGIYLEFGLFVFTASFLM